jgi:hypothetical protein
MSSIMKVYIILLYVATFANADDVTCTADGQCDAKDTQALLQSRVAVSELGSDDDWDDDWADVDDYVRGVFKFPPEKATDSHKNEKGFEVITKVEKACAACDLVCEKKQLKASFIVCDDDKNKILTVQEVHDCMFDGGVVGDGGKDVNASDAVLSTATAEQFVKEHDADGSNDLTRDEFLDSLESCDTTSLLADNTTISETRAVAMRLKHSVESYKKNHRKMFKDCECEGLLEKLGVLEGVLLVMPLENYHRDV